MIRIIFINCGVIKELRIEYHLNCIIELHENTTEITSLISTRGLSIKSNNDIMIREGIVDGNIQILGNYNINTTKNLKTKKIYSKTINNI